MSEQEQGALVVGYDGSPDATAALEWAIREAASRQAAIRIVHAEPPISAIDAVAGTFSGSQAAAMPLEHHGRELVARAAERASQAGLPVTTLASEGPTASVLIAESRNALMLVLGSRGVGSLASVILGSTVSHVATHAACPVIVTAAGGDPQGPVVVGIDGSKQSQVVLAWALDHADRHDLPVEVLHCYQVPVYPGVVPYVPPVELTDATAEHEADIAHEAIAGWRERYPGLSIRATVRHGRPAQLLVEASAGASLTVVGSHGRGAFLGMLMGSTSQSLLHHARGSVAVLRVPR